MQTFDNRLLKEKTVEATKSRTFMTISTVWSWLVLTIFRSTSSMRFRHKPWTRSKRMLLKARALDIPHMSLYSLILENHTVFMNRMRRGKLPLPKERLEAEIFEYIIQELGRRKLWHYEISFSKPESTQSHVLGQCWVLWSGNWSIRLCRWDSLQDHGPIRHYMQAVEE